MMEVPWPFTLIPRAPHLREPGEPEPTAAAAGKSMIGGGVVMAACAVVLRDDPFLFGAVLGGVLMAFSTGVLFWGAPASRRGVPAASRFVALFAMAVAGLVAQFLISPWVALGIAQVVLVILILNAVRGQDAPLQQHVAVAAKLVSVVSLVGVALQATDSGPLRLGIIAVGLLLTFGLRIFPAPLPQAETREDGPSGEVGTAETM